LLFGTKSHKNEHSSELSKLLYQPGVFMMQTNTQHIQCSQNKLIANQFSRSKVIDCVGELLTTEALERLAPRETFVIAFSHLAVKWLMYCLVIQGHIAIFFLILSYFFRLSALNVHINILPGYSRTHNYTLFFFYQPSMSI
jgi:hypothetical protein